MEYAYQIQKLIERSVSGRFLDAPIGCVQRTQQLSERSLLLMYSFRSSNQHFGSGTIHQWLRPAEKADLYNTLI